MTRKNNKQSKFASYLEEVIYNDAKSRGIQIEYEPRTFDYYKRPPRGSSCKDCGGTRIGVPGQYTPDFFVNGRIYVEAKGFFKAEKRSNMEDFIKCNATRELPIDLRFIFAQDNWMTRKKKHKYSDWAKKVGVKYHVGKKIPANWIIEIDGTARADRAEPDKLGSNEDLSETSNNVNKRGKTRRKPTSKRAKSLTSGNSPSGGDENI